MWATLLLPLNADDSIDFGRLETQAATLTTTELDGLYAHGTAGEFQTLTEAEFDQVNEVLAGTGKPFQIGASHPSAQVQLDRVRRAAAREPGAIQVILPDWLPLNDWPGRPHDGSCPNCSRIPGSLGSAVHSTRERPVQPGAEGAIPPRNLSGPWTECHRRLWSAPA